MHDMRALFESKICKERLSKNLGHWMAGLFATQNSGCSEMVWTAGYLFAL